MNKPNKMGVLKYLSSVKSVIVRSYIILKASKIFIFECVLNRNKFLKRIKGN